MEYHQERNVFRLIYKFAQVDITIFFHKFILSNITIRSRIVAYFVANIMHVFVELTDYYQRIILLNLSGFQLLMLSKMTFVNGYDI